jgi:MraZ protein
VEVDKLGRVLIPPHLRAHAELGRDTVWMGSISHIQLWDKGRHASATDSVLADAERTKAVARRLAELGL